MYRSCQNLPASPNKERKITKGAIRRHVFQPGKCAHIYLSSKYLSLPIKTLKPRKYTITSVLKVIPKLWPPLPFVGGFLSGKSRPRSSDSPTKWRSIMKSPVVYSMLNVNSDEPPEQPWIAQDAKRKSKLNRWMKQSKRAAGWSAGWLTGWLVGKYPPYHHHLALRHRRPPSDRAC